MAKKFITKDTGHHKQFKSGMNREIDEGKPRFDLILPNKQKLENTLLYRWAMLMERGAIKYDERNWEKSNSIEELERFKSSAFRHFIQAIKGVEDGEDHFAAVCFNINAIVFLTDNLGVDFNGKKDKKNSLE